MIDVRTATLNAEPIITNPHGWHDMAHVIGIAIHHTVTLWQAPGLTPAQERAHIAVIDRYHASKGWGGFRYHLIAFRSGRVYLCGDLRRSRAHVRGRNLSLIGVAAAGRFQDAPAPTPLIAGMSQIDLADAYAIDVQCFGVGSGKTLTNWTAFHAHSLTTGTNRRGCVCDDIGGGTIARYLELGSLPDFTVKARGEWTPAPNETPVWVAEGASPTARQVRWKDGASIGAGDRVMVLILVKGT